ncbi:MAG: hypothetical protein ABFC67_01515 [Mizugakiibacter sp.]|uniref:WD40/YVTN/BNR-like repeat-containing protein n=1 Tax=Mizugakiibacter sp. TaxID=1972610 RepID=UPI0031BE1550|nr:hypothetical protein [Xanthomonadaceae bacterium]
MPARPYTAPLAAALALALATFAVAAQTPDALSEGHPFAHLAARNIGPASAGGRVAAVAGIAGDPRTYYVGAGGGGVFKTTDGGLSWKPVFEHEATSSIGAIALAPGNPNLVWVGTGEANIRNDVVDGAGVYLSTDAGQSWKRMGLADVGQIGRIVVDPQDADHVLVAALGHTWGPNAERGVFETRDGGKSWKKVLFVDDKSGAIDVAFQPGNPKVLLAATWQVVRHPWGLEDGGAGSGLWRSSDGGDTWTRLGEGLPKAPLGRIALAFAPAQPDRVYALVEAKRGDGLLYRSDDLGAHWNKVNENYALDVRPFYFSQIRVDPANADHVYFLSFNLWQSFDGGKTASLADKGVHPDHHALWIDPADPKRLLQGNDGGAYLSLDGGASWRFLDGMPIEQSYTVAADSREPYGLCTGLQDNFAWCGASSTLADGAVGAYDWEAVLSGDGEYAVPAPSDPDIVYADVQDGAIFRIDRRTHQTLLAMPYLHSPGFINDLATADQAIRFNWTSPILVDPHDADTVYLGGSKLLKSTDGGAHWQPVSGDLTRNDKSKQQLSGGPINKDLSGAETYDTILSLAMAPADPKVIWAGTDDGLVQVTRDGGAHWSNVTPHGAPAWARVYQIDAPAGDAGTAYVAFDAHMLDDHQPYAFKTTDYGRSWKRIDKGLPEAPVFVVRADPRHAGVLVAGTAQGAWLSRDGGARWQRIDAELPTAPVWDLKFVRDDLVLATHGRGLFVFDHFDALAEAGDGVRGEKLHVFTPRAGTEYQRWSRGEGAEPAFTAANAPDGAVLDYWLPEKLEADAEAKKQGHTAVKLVVTDAAGHVVATRWGKADAGVNRFVWDMRYDGPTRLDFEKKPEGVDPDEGGGGGEGPMVLPGRYQMAVSAGGVTRAATLEVRADPNQKPALDAQRAALAAALHARDEASAVNAMLNRLHALHAALARFEDAAGDGDDSARYAAILARAKALDAKLTALQDAMYLPGVQHDAFEDDLHALADLHGAANATADALAGLGTQAPTPPLQDLVREVDARIAARLDAFNALLKDVVAYNQAAYAAGAPTLMAGEAIAVKTTAP